MSEALDLGRIGGYAPWLSCGDAGDQLVNGFEGRREESRVYLQREHEASSKNEVEIFLGALRRLLGGLGLVEHRHDQDATVFENAKGDIQVMLHRWRGALKKSEGLPDCPTAISAKNVAENEIDTEGWTVAISGTGPQVRGITRLITNFFSSSTPIKTKGGNQMYSFGYPAQHEMRMEAPVRGRAYMQDGAAM